MMKRSGMVLAFVCSLLLTEVVTAGSAAKPGAEAPPLLKIEDAWVRAVPPSQRSTAAYMRLVNDTDTAHGVVAVTADVARKSEIHTTRKVDGYLRMERLEGVAVAPGETVALAPGGAHVMLMGLAFVPEPGDVVKICLTLLTGQEVCTDAVTHRSEPTPSK